MVFFHSLDFRVLMVMELLLPPFSPPSFSPPLSFLPHLRIDRVGFPFKEGHWPKVTENAEILQLTNLAFYRSTHQVNHDEYKMVINITV